jgi:hypothetical protein
MLYGKVKDILEQKTFIVEMKKAKWTIKDESYNYNQFSEALHEKMIILADKLKPKIYEYGFLRK